VGDDVYACEVVSAADDYRYAGLSGEPAELRPTQLPADITERCIDAARALGLHFAGIDLRLAPDGRWFCFEVNPSPGFTYYEAHTRQPIADAVANLLANAR
jgi:D-alanine-D-alanine ligase-like ATP-grasp enzyme